jgi:DNA-directed RNA polymerase specialized sigma24 family protein
MYFPTTQWTLLARASLNGESSARQALEELCKKYWTPLHQFIRLRGYEETEAQDLTQEFLLHLVEHSTLHKADRMRGRFRSFLCGALVRFLSDERDRRLAQKRGGAAEHLSVERENPLLAVPEATSVIFDREWALAILENALATVRQEGESAGSKAQFAVLRQFLPGSVQTPSYEDAASQLGLTVPALKSELHRMRRRFRAAVRQEVAATVSAPHEIDEEMNHLQAVLMDKGSDLGETKKPTT